MKFFILCYIAFIAYLYILQRQFIYAPSKEQPVLGGFSDIYTEVQTSTRDGLALTHWHSRQKKPYIVVFHGNAGNIEDRAYVFQFLAEQKYSLLLVSYRGYGSNSGKPSEKYLIDDSALVLEWLLKTEKITPHDLILFGESMGSGVAAALAVQYPVKALIFDGAPSSIEDIAKIHYSFVPVSLLLKDTWDSKKRIQKVKAPILFIHSKKDSVVPFHLGKKLFSLANEPKKHIWLEEGDHNSNLEKESVQKSIVDFIQSVL